MVSVLQKELSKLRARLVEIERAQVAEGVVVCFVRV